MSTIDVKLEDLLLSDAPLSSLLRNLGPQVVGALEACPLEY